MFGKSQHFNICYYLYLAKITTFPEPQPKVLSLPKPQRGTGDAISSLWGDSHALCAPVIHHSRLLALINAMLRFEHNPASVITV